MFIDTLAVFLEEAEVMKIVKFLSQVDETICTGDKRCERICPSGAIKVIEKKAKVDEKKCVACGKCEDICREAAVKLVPRSEPLTIMFNPGQSDEERIRELCNKAHLYPDQFVCPCSGTLVKEAAAAILNGAKSPEELTWMTGARSGCGIYCMGAILRLFKAHGVDIPTDKAHRWYNLPLSLWDVPAKVGAKYPGYYLEEDKKVLFKQS
jgi:ferredoxin/bacterioferritin-associated ferredoxin